jgi:hypothetical protein
MPIPLSVNAKGRLGEKDEQAESHDYQLMKNFVIRSLPRLFVLMADLKIIDFRFQNCDRYNMCPGATSFDDLSLVYIPKLVMISSGERQSSGEARRFSPRELEEVRMSARGYPRKAL